MLQSEHIERNICYRVNRQNGRNGIENENMLQSEKIELKECYSLNTQNETSDIE